LVGEDKDEAVNVFCEKFLNESNYSIDGNKKNVTSFAASDNKKVDNLIISL